MEKVYETDTNITTEFKHLDFGNPPKAPMFELSRI